MPRSPKEEEIRLRIEGPLKAEVEAMAAEAGESMSVMIRQLLRKLTEERRQRLAEQAVAEMPITLYRTPEESLAPMRVAEPGNQTSEGT